MNDRGTPAAREAGAIGTLAPDVRLFTKTYGPDLQYVVGLLDNLKALGCTLPHVVVVDDRDLDAAQVALAGFGADIIPSSVLLPRRLRRWARQYDFLRSRHAEATWRKPLWSLALKAWHRFRGQTTGWWLQQITKLSASTLDPAAIFVNVDSDQVFVRRPTSDWFLTSDGRVKLFTKPPDSLKHIEWKLRAHKFLDIERYAQQPSTYTTIPQVLASSLLTELQQHIEHEYRGPWWKTVLRHRVTEYELYGCYASDLRDAVVVESHDWSLEISSWHPAESIALLRTIVEEGGRPPRVVCVQSTLNDAERTEVRSLLQRLPHCPSPTAEATT